jgi:hypothetical protein
MYALVIERDPVQSADLLASFLYWLQAAGGFAAFGLALWLVAAWLRTLLEPRKAVSLHRRSHFDPLAGTALADAPEADRRSQILAAWLRRLFFAAAGVATVVYGILGLLQLPAVLRQAWAFLAGQTYTPPKTSVPAWLLTQGLIVGGSAALFAVLLPFGVGLAAVRPRRIWAIALLTIKEVIRRRVLWVFLLLGLVFLFGTWFIGGESHNQVRNYVEIVYLTMAILLVLTASLVASFSIPTDVKQQTIHTVLTKPVERFELVLGRFIGFGTVMTLVLVIMTAFSLLYVLRGVDPDAAKESLKARVPVYGELEFEGTKDRKKGENVGEEWDYRSYISGPFPQQPIQTAIWSFPYVPRSLARRDKVPCEFTFSIYRTTTGEINKGVFCTFTVESWRWNPSRRDEFNKERERLKGQLSEAEIADTLAQQFGLYELPSKEVINYHTLAFDVPGGLFKNYFASAHDLQPRIKELEAKGGGLSTADAEELAALEKVAKGHSPPPLKVRARCVSRTQFLGMARYDLYLRQDEEQAGYLRQVTEFGANFFKGALGICFWMCLVLSLALACSSYLSGVISWLCVLFLVVVGWGRDFVQSIAEGKNEGGGPAESLIRLFERQNAVLPLEDTTATRVATGYDEVYRWLLRRVMDILPDVALYFREFFNPVASGFDISATTIAKTLLLLAGYLLLWAVLAYYLIKSREVASSS